MDQKIYGQTQKKIPNNECADMQALKKIYYNKNVRLRNTVLSGYDTVLVNSEWSMVSII